MKIVFGMALSDKRIERVKNCAPEAEVVTAPTNEELAGELAEAEILVTFGMEITRELIDSAPRLRWIHAATTGIDQFSPLGLDKKGITLTNSRGVHGSQMCEQIFCFMLSLIRRSFKYFEHQKEHSWQREEMDTLDGKTLLIIGVGAIGAELARRARVFNMQVVGVKKKPSTIPDLDRVVPAEELHSVLPQADFTVILVPYTAETHHLIGKQELSLMKEEAFLINVSRGSIVNQHALVEALQNKVIAGAGLDVTDPEPLPADSELWDLDNVIITPHVGGFIPGYYDMILDLFCENLKAYRTGKKPPKNLVNLQRGY